MVHRGDHRLAFRVTTGSGDLLLRLTRLDSDDDGLMDHWESRGIDFNQDGQIDLDLAALGANPVRKDVFVEADYMVKPITNESYRPDTVGLEAVAKVFGKRRVALHVLVDDGDSISHASSISFGREDKDGIPLPAPYFEDMKFGAAPSLCGTGHFGKPAERASPNCQNILGARHLAFRYFIFGEAISDEPRASGIAEFLGNDGFIATHDRNALKSLVGDPTLSCFNGTEQRRYCGIREFEMGTLTHELGHMLGLLHGGDDLQNCKPNYLSVMSYTLQFRHAWGDTRRPLGFSDVALPILTGEYHFLDEAHLNEAIGIEYTGEPRMVVHGTDTGDVKVVPAVGAINWDGQGGISTGTVEQNLNFISRLGDACPAQAAGTSQPKSSLVGYNDWDLMRFEFDATRQVLTNAGTPWHPEDESPLDIASLNLFDTDGDGIADGEDNCPNTPNSSQADANGDGFGDDCQPQPLPYDTEVALTASPSPVVAGQPLTLTLTVNNVGSASVAAVIATTQLPPTVSFTSLTASQGSCSRDGLENIRCTLGSIGVGNSATVTVVGATSTAGTLKFEAFALSDLLDHDANGGNDTALLTVNATPQL
ncbi:hypothetical protein [Corallococcus caeni]|uniref:hypothetical protein n=1 Tax=Corallococcus caeni TaxID=3082388 RepID=UPI0030C6AD71